MRGGLMTLHWKMLGNDCFQTLLFDLLHIKINVQHLNLLRWQFQGIKGSFRFQIFINQSLVFMYVLFLLQFGKYSVQKYQRFYKELTFAKQRAVNRKNQWYKISHFLNTPLLNISNQLIKNLPIFLNITSFRKNRLSP